MPAFPALPVGATEESFRNLYGVASQETHEPPKKILKIFQKTEIPKWLSSIGKVSYGEGNRFKLEIPEALLAHLAGFTPKKDLVFSVECNIDLWQDFLKLLKSNVGTHPTFLSHHKPRVGWAMQSLANSFRATSLNFAILGALYEESWNDTDFMDNLLLPSLMNNYESILALQRHVRHLVLPLCTPGSLRQRYVEAPIYPFWPEGESLEELRKFFRFKSKRWSTAVRGRGRGSRGRGFRGRARRGFFRSNFKSSGGKRPNSESNKTADQSRN